MRLDVIADSVRERIIRRLNLAPVPLVHTHIAQLLARSVIEASRFGVFDALAAAPLAADAVAERCGLHPGAAAKLLAGLATSGYLAFDAASDRFALTPMARKWMLTSSPVSLHDKIVFQSIEDGFIDRMGDYLRTGASVSGGGHLGNREPEFWRQYQRAMRAVASIAADEVARRTYVPRGAREMLDIGGSHGLYSVRLCRRHAELSSTILDLPSAVDQAAPLLAAEGVGGRVTHQVGDVLGTDLGAGRYDLIFIASLVHHFDEATNRALMKRMAAALRPGGAVVVQELVRRRTPTDGGQLGALLDLYFALTSESGTWSVEEIASWQAEAGLVPRAPVWLRTVPGGAQQAGVRMS